MQGNQPFNRPPPPGAFGAPPGAPPPFPNPAFAGGGPPGGPDGGYARLNLPAILIMVAMGLGIFMQILNLLLNVAGAGIAASGGAFDPGMMMSGAVGLVTLVISLALGGFVIFAMTKMKKGENYTLSVVGVIIAMIPCISPCCFLGLPFGIWALVVLNDQNVKASFKS